MCVPGAFMLHSVFDEPQPYVLSHTSHCIDLQYSSQYQGCVTYGNEAQVSWKRCKVGMNVPSCLMPLLTLLQTAPCVSDSSRRTDHYCIIQRSSYVWRWNIFAIGTCAVIRVCPATWRLQRVRSTSIENGPVLSSRYPRAPRWYIQYPSYLASIRQFHPAAVVVLRT